AVAVSPDGTTAYTANNDSNSVSVINTATNTVTATIAVGSKPEAAAVSPDGSTAYITNAGSNSVSVISICGE
ncbi:MAG: YncE family protein, partial [Myxococcales bacterium]|nr:YncE family protein [Myxococcales bacterium]